MEYTYTLIIPHYNIPRLLGRLLMTVPNREDLQIIVVDDCSLTEYQEQFKELAFLYPKVEFYSTEINGGGGKARNVGLKYAKGRYVLFADADDFFTPGICLILDKYKDTDAEMVIFQAISLNSETFHINSRAAELDYWIKLYNKNNQLGLFKLKYVFGEPWCRLIKRSLLIENNIKFQETACHNDTKFAYLIGHKAHKIQIELTVGYVITYRTNSVVNTQYKDRYQIEENIFSEKEKFFMDNKIPTHTPDLYIPLIRDLARMRVMDFYSKYRSIHNKHPEFRIKSALFSYLIRSILFKLSFNKYIHWIK